MMKEARRAEAQQRIAVAKSRLLAVQQRLQAQAEKAVAAGAADEGGALGSADQLVRSVLAAAADSQQLRSDAAATAAATALAAKVAAEAARADQAAAEAAAAAATEARRQQQLLARLAQQLDAVQAGAAPGGAAAAEPAAAAAGEPAQRRSRGWDPLSILLAPAAPLLAALGRAHSHRGGGAPRHNKYDSLLELMAAAAAAPQAQVWARAFLRRHGEGGELGGGGGGFLGLQPIACWPACACAQPCPCSAHTSLPCAPCAARQGCQFDDVRSLLAAAPASGPPRYDFARSLVRQQAGLGAGQHPGGRAASGGAGTSLVASAAMQGHAAVEACPRHACQLVPGTRPGPTR
jgi:hypothetical protein